MGNTLSKIEGKKEKADSEINSNSHLGHVKILEGYERTKHKKKQQMIKYTVSFGPRNLF